MLRLLLYRRSNKILEFNDDDDTFKFIDIYADENDEIKSHTSFTEPDRIGSINGYYCEGIQNDILMLYMKNKEPKIRYDGKVYNLLDRTLKFNCYPLREKNWIFECISPNNGFQFIYKPYVYDPYDDEDELDVNFGLWLMSIIQSPDKLKKAINTS